MAQSVGNGDLLQAEAGGGVGGLTLGVPLLDKGEHLRSVFVGDRGGGTMGVQQMEAVTMVALALQLFALQLRQGLNGIDIVKAVPIRLEVKLSRIPRFQFLQVLQGRLFPRQ